MNQISYGSLLKPPDVNEPSFASAHFFESLIEYTIASYEKLACEYDSPSHQTTRVLEQLSQSCLRSAILKGHLPISPTRTIDIGTGTGSLLESALETEISLGDIDLLDSSLGMLTLAASKLAGHRETCCVSNMFTLSAFDIAIGGQLCGNYDLVLSGLSDPFLNSETIFRLADLIRPGGSIFVSVPDLSWAIRERYERLGIPLAFTRFRLCSSEFVYPLSFCYVPDQLDQLLKAAGLSPICAYTRKAISWDGQYANDCDNIPAVACAIATKPLKAGE